ncbi:erbin-like [Gigantopelta aegis]|uniref:erbin-like n=1 Tax=Gigantopelta aegis TaxID=1735272 RepID=UPI001B88D85C|nr:erbin-like [Gigantopelta aegis]
MAGFVRKCPCLKPQIEEDVRVLDYRHCSLTDVPGEVFNFERTLEELYADSNQIRDLPRELFYCHGLRKLSISDNEIKTIPPAISSLISLEELDFSKNGIIDVPDSIKSCKYLSVIEASVNPLGKLPEGFTQLQNLSQLFLNDTFIDYLPGSFGRLVHLKILEIRENHLKTLPRSFGRLTALERLDIGNNEFTELPDVIGSLTSLLELWCDKNQMTKFTSNFGNLKQLMFLDASNNNLESLPEEIDGCNSLADIHLTTNNLKILPDSIGNLNNLTTLKVDDNQLRALPTTLGGLSAMSELNVSANDLQSLPASIGLLRNLRTFYADENLLEFLPAELGSCSGITVMSLRSNKLTYIPDEIGRIPRLRVLNLSDNQLLHLPFSFIKLKELQALWLTENQTRPLITLQSDIDPDNGRKILTCYLLPQGPLQDNGGGEGGDTDSFHASMWDEERARRQQIHFQFGDDVDTDGQLVRCPTPYPKEMRQKARHVRNLALRQTDEHLPCDQGEENFGYESEGYRHGDSSPDVRMREAHIMKSSPSLQETHKLFRFDKEKLIKDKARMQQHRRSQEFDDETAKLLSPRSKKDNHRQASQKDEDDGGFSIRESNRASHGSTPNISNQSTSQSDQTEVCRASKITYITDSDYAHLPHYGQHSRGRHLRRLRDYDSDTGYRSDPEVVKFHQRFLNDQRNHVNTLSHPSNSGHTRIREGGYSSDLETYSGKTRAAAYRIPSLAQQIASNSLPYDLHNEIQKTVSDSAAVPHSRRILMNNGDLCNQGDDKNSAKTTTTTTPLLMPLDSPSPSLFHRGRFIDQSTPVTLEPPQSFPPSQSFLPQDRQSVSSATDDLDYQREFRHDLYTVLEERMHKQAEAKQMERERQASSQQTKLPPYIPAPPYRHTPERTPSCSSGDHSHANSPRNVNTSPRTFSDSPREKLVNGDPANSSGSKSVRDYETWTLNRSQSQSQQSPCPGWRQAQNYSADPSMFRSPQKHHGASCPGNPSSQGSRYERDRSNSRTKEDESDSSVYVSIKSGACGDANNSSYSSDQERRSQTFSRTNCSNYDPNRTYDSLREHGMHEEQSNLRTFGTPQSKSSDSRLRERPRSTGYESQAGGYDPHSHVDPGESAYPVMTRYEDVEMFKSDPPSQVSSSTDSGYGHSHHLYEKLGNYSHRTDQHSSSRQSSSPSTHPYSMSRCNSSSSREIQVSGSSREGTPIKEESETSYCQESRDLIRICIKKNPGLGFSIGGGCGSYGNPYRKGDVGIFVTKIQPNVLHFMQIITL